MKTFLQEVIEQIHKANNGFENLVFILPNKRAGLFLKKHITAHINKPIFSPEIYSIEELVVQISELDSASNLDLLLGLYEAFLPYLTSGEDDFASFITWGNTLLSDFNEIDRHLVSPSKLFDYLTANQRLKLWGADKKATPFISETLKFWSKLNMVYISFQKYLRSQEIGHQGLLYRKAVAHVDEFIVKNDKKTFHFIGFNALNKAEEHIFNSFSRTTKSRFWWDIDSYFLEDNIHEAGFFIRNYVKKWPNNSILSEANNTFLSEEKRIKITGIPKSISQAKFSAMTLNDMLEDEKGNEIALVLSDERLLAPIVNSLPQNATKVNVTMGLPLQKTSLYDFFDSLFNLYLNRTKNGWFFKEVNRVLSNPCSYQLTHSKNGNISTLLNQYIKENNLLYINHDILDVEPFSTSQFLNRLFRANDISGQSFVIMCLEFINDLKEKYQASSNHFEEHSLYGFFRLFNQLESYMSTKPYLSSLKSIKSLFDELVSTEQIDFRGEPMGGLQIMGVLESRNLDFESVIITSVNEGILPAGKNQNSFIPFDIKKEFGLPTYKEKDAVYAYHFYRLLQRAKNIHILYNTEPDILQGNEKSRFISQLLTDTNIAKNIVHDIAVPDITIDVAQPKSIQKTQALSKRLKEMAQNGFSPSSLTNYIRNPYGFYTQSVLGLSEVEDVEENIAHNTFGTIVHDSLEELYAPLIGQKITPESLNPLKERIHSITRSNFEKYFPPKDIERGQNLIAFHVVQKYISGFIDLDFKRSKKHEIELLALEKNLRIPISVPGYPHPVYLKGKLDRLERIDDSVQILDYKTGNVSLSEVELINIEECTTNEKRSKAFQLLCYALMESYESGLDNLLAGIVPIKKLSSGILLFAQKEGPRGPKEHIIDRELLVQFNEHLAELILEILNPEIVFKERESTSL